MSTFPTGWSYKRQISIDSGQKSGSPTGIVLTITEDSGLADANGPLDADGTAPAQNGGGDLRVSSDSAGANQIPLDVVSFVTDNDHASATCELKVNFDDLSSDTLYLWWGTAGTESQPAVTDTYGRNAVYSSGNHLVVYSMDEDPSVAAPQITDRTGNGNDGTSSGSMTSGDVVTGQVGSALDLDNSDDYLTIGAPITIDADVALTVSWWEKIASGSGAFPARFRLKNDGPVNRAFFIIRNSNATYQHLTWGGSYTSLAVPGANFRGSDVTSIASSIGAWKRFTLVCSNGTGGSTTGDYAIYEDGASKTVASAAGINGANTVSQVGYDSIDNAANCAMDEVRLYARALTSADEVTLYNCESDNASFWSVGSVESTGGGSSTVPHVMYYKRMMTG